MATLLGNPEELVRAQAQVASPDVVLEMLKKYRAHLVEESSGRFMGASGDNEFEEVILNRHDLGLNLELAYSATNAEVIQSLWKQSNDVSLDLVYRQGLKVAVLSGLRPSFIFNIPNSFDPINGELDPIEFLNDESDDNNFAHQFLTNPFAIGYVGSFMKDEEFLGKFPEIRQQLLFRYMVRNPLINRDLSNSDGPDFTHWNIQKGVKRFFLTAPATKLWFWAFEDAISNLTSSTLYLEPEEYKAIIDRWSTVDLGDGSNEGFYTDNDIVKESLCRFAALFGRVESKTKLSAESIAKLPNLVERYAYYGNQKFNAAEVESLLQLDYQNFRLGVISNEYTLRDLKARQVFEEWVNDEGSIYYLFEKTCKRIKEEHPEYQLPSGVKTDVKDAGISTSELENQLQALKGLVVNLSNNNQKTESLIKYTLGIVAMILIFLFSKF